MLTNQRKAILVWSLAIALSITSLGTNPFADDFFHRLALAGTPLKLPFGALSLYNFTGVDGISPLVAEGYFPWQSHPELSFRFLRPLASLSIACDYYLFGRSALPSHLINLGWYLSLVAIALAILNRVLPKERSWLASLLYVSAGAHTINLAWIAGRHMLLASVFGSLALLLHLRARAPLPSETRVPTWLVPVAFILALLSSEAALPSLAFLFSYELFGRSDALRSRLRALVPVTALGGAYLGVYSSLGFGSSHSGTYVSPFRQPLAFLQALTERAPCLLAELTTAFPSGLWGNLPQARTTLAALGVAGGVALVLLVVIAPLDDSAKRQMRWLGIATLGAILVLTGSDPSVSLYGLASIAYYRPEFFKQVPRLFVISHAPHPQNLEVTGPGAFTLSVKGLPRKSNLFETLFNDTEFHVNQRVSFGELRAHVLAVDHGLPTRVAFTVPTKCCLLLLEGKRLVSHALPPVGQSLAVAYEKGPMGL